MASEDYKLQVSIRSHQAANADMINIRANTVDELSILLEGISDYATQIAATAKMVTGAYSVSPLGTTGSTVESQPAPTYSTAQTQPPSAGAGGMSTPTCIHGARIFRSGTSKTTGKPYAFWACPTPQGTPDQCKPAN
jgi:hypothetical protein